MCIVIGEDIIIHLAQKHIEAGIDHTKLILAHYGICLLWLTLFIELVYCGMYLIVTTRESGHLKAMKRKRNHETYS